MGHLPMSHNQREKKSLTKGEIAGLVIIVLVIMWVIYSVLYPSPPSTPTSTRALQPTDFYDRATKACLVQNTTTLTSLYKLYVYVTNRLNLPVSYVDVSLTMNSTSFSDGMTDIPLVPTQPLHIPNTWWTVHGANLTFYDYLPVNGSMFGHPHAYVTGVLLTVFVSIEESGQVERFGVYPELNVTSLTSVPVCIDVKSG